MAEATPLQVAVETVESVYMGDHAERLRKSHKYMPGETVEDLVRRVHPGLRPFRNAEATDEVVLRVVLTEDETTLTGRGDDPF